MSGDFDVGLEGEYLFDVGTSEHKAIMYFSARSVVPPRDKGFYYALYLFDEGNSDDSKNAHKLLKEAASSGESHYKGLTLIGETSGSFEFYSAVGETALTLATSSSVGAKLTFIQSSVQKDTSFVAQLQIGHGEKAKIIKIPFDGEKPEGSRIGKVKQIAANDSDRLKILNDMGHIKRKR
jgi:hypothetical protein